MKIRNYQDVIDKSIIEVKKYLLAHSEGYYQQDIHDIMNQSIDVFCLKRKLNQRKDIQVWLFSQIKKSIDQCLSYDQMEEHLIYMNILIDPFFKPLLEYKYNLFYYILNRSDFTIEIYCLLRHLLKMNFRHLDNYITSMTSLLNLSEYQYHHISSEILLLEKQYKQAYRHLPCIEFDHSLERYQKALYNYSPRQYEMLFRKEKKMLRLQPVR